MKTRVAVIGVGHLGTFHARNYAGLDDVRLVGVCDIDAERACAVAEETNCHAFTDYRELLDKVDAVSIAVPTVNHYAIAKEILPRGIATLIEKPITPTVCEAKELSKLAKKHKTVLQVGHIERFNSAVEAIRSSRGKTKFIETHRLGPFKKRSLDISVVLDLMIHDLDIILWLVQSHVKKIDAVGVHVLSSHADIANARITFANGCVANITASRLTPTSTRKIRIFQDDCYISLDYAEQEAFVYHNNKGQIAKNLIDIRKEEPLRRELSSFVQAARTGTQPEVTGEDATAALKLALAIQKKISRS